MKIKNIEMKNFRSYCGINRFQINPGLTLIIGANGEGKTNLYDAMTWLFDNELHKDQKRVISKKALASLIEGDEDEVIVALDFEHNDKSHRIEKTFKFTKEEDGNVKASPIKFIGYTEESYGRIQTDGSRLLDRCFNASIRHYSLMAGEESLRILNEDKTLQYLINTFSAVRNGKKFEEFTELATFMAQRASQNAITKNGKRKKDVARLTQEIEDLSSRLSTLKHELKKNKDEAKNYTDKIEDIVSTSEAASEMRDLQSRLDKLTNDKIVCRSRINENYSVALLDDMMVLGGIMPIIREFSEKIAKYERIRRKEEQDFLLKKGEKIALKKIRLELENGATPLPVYAPDAKFMREMLNDHICKVCGTPAPEGSESYKYIQAKLDAYLDSLKEEEDKEEQCFMNAFIPEIAKLDTIINNEGADIAKTFQKLQDLIDYNEARKVQLRNIEDNINQVEEDQEKLLARAPGMTKDGLINNFVNLTNWNKIKSDFESKILDLTIEISSLESDIASKQDELNKLAENTPAAIYTAIFEAFKAIENAFKGALKRNKTEFIHELEKVSNEYLGQLNIEDFKGTIHIREDYTGAMQISLVDLDGARIDANKALETTMYMSVLFAVSKLTEIKKDDEYPLFFDAPTSSFAEGKEKDFFRIIDNLDKQVIIVTKSFLKEIGKNMYEVDYDMIEELNLQGTIYRIEKKRPFDDKNQATIQTVIKQIR